MNDANLELRAALRAYAERAIAALQEAEWSLPPDHLRGWGWRAGTNGLFVYRAIESTSELLPSDLRSLHALPESAACVEALRAHPVIGERLDTLVGSPFSASRLDADHVPDLILYRMLGDAPDLEFSESRFEDSADELVTWLTRERAAYTTLAPLSGATAEETPIVLDDGIEIDAMTDAEVIDCLTTGILGGVGSMGHAQVGPRVALRIRDSFELAFGDEHPDFVADEKHQEKFQAIWERLRDTGEAVVFALRLLKPGSISSPGFVSRGDEHLGGSGGSFTPSATPRHTIFERYRLDAADGAELAVLWSQLSNPPVKKSKPLATAIRRFGLAGERARPDDQIIDLMIAAEALFLPGEDRGESAHKLSLRAGLLLADENQTAQDIATIMKRAYDARSKLAHGATLKALKLPDGSPATLPEYVEIVEGYMRTAIRTLVDAAAEGKPSPLDDWDAFTFRQLSRET